MGDLKDCIINAYCLVYILRLEQDKYYVGSTDHLNSRLFQHYNNKGSNWTKKYKPIKIVGIKIGNRETETKVTLAMMKKHGIENVRGGGYCKCDLCITDELREKVRVTKPL